MTASPPALHLVPSDTPDLRDPVVYQREVMLVQRLAICVAGMPLDELGRLATDATHLATLKGVDADTLHRIRADRDVIEVMASAQRQLAKVRARYSL